MTSTIIHDHTPTGELPAITQPRTIGEQLDRVAAQRRGGWISDGTRPSGRHRAGPHHRVHVSAIDGVDLSRRPQRIGSVAKAPTVGLLTRLLGGGA